MDEVSFEHPDLGQQMHMLCRELFPICRSLTGQGVRETFKILQQQLQDLVTYEVPSGETCFDWTIPDEWNVNQAYIISPNGEKVVDFANNNLHLVGYSTPINAKISLQELDKHLHSLENIPDAIPYITSYYSGYWGFCLTHRERQKLVDGLYQVVIDSEKTKGSMTYGELILQGETEKEILLSTYICHPSMANNELSGPVVATYLAKWLSSFEHYYTYRIVFVPETIGSIYYIFTNLEKLKKNVIAGYVLTCIGDDRTYSFLPSRAGNSLSDKTAKHVLKHHFPDYKEYSYLERASDERQYCSPGVDLPVASVMRSKYWEYPEYHTSLDDLGLVTPSGLFGGYLSMKRIIGAIENNHTYQAAQLCEPQLGKRGLYPNLGTADAHRTVRNRMNLLAYADGQHDLLSIAEQLEVPVWDLYSEAKILTESGLLKIC